MSDLSAAAALAPAPAPAAADPAAAPVAAPAAAAPAPVAAPAAAAPAAAPAAPPLTVPGKDAKPEDWKAFFKTIGAPETAEGYALPVPEGGDKAFATEAATIMAEVGLLPQQAQKLAEWWNSKAGAMTADQQKAIDSAAAARAEQSKVEDAKLRNEWGQNYEANVNQAKAAVRQFFPADKQAGVVEALEQAIGYEQTFRVLQSIGKGLGTGQARGLGDGGGQGAPQTLAQALYPNMKP